MKTNGLVLCLWSLVLVTAVPALGTVHFADPLLKTAVEDALQILNPNADDMLGLTEGPTPRFVKPYAQARKSMVKAIAGYKNDVLAGRFPTKAHSY